MFESCLADMTVLKTLRVLHISTPLTWRGGESQLAYLASSLEDRGIVQAVACAQGGAVEAYSHQRNLVAYSFPPRQNLGVRMLWGLAAAIRNFKPTVIHCHDAHAHTFGLLAQKIVQTQIPMIVSRRVCFPLKTHYFSRKKYQYPLTARIVCVSQAIADGIRAQQIVDARKLQVIHDGVELFIEPQINVREMLMAQFNIPSQHAGSQWIVNCSALTDEKDLDSFLDVASKIKDTRDDAVFFIFGSGKKQAELEARIKQENLRHTVFLGGFWDNVRSLLPAFDVFMMTSKSEGLGSSILDAMVAGIPVIATRTGGIPEVVLDNQTGLLVEVGDVEGMTRALSNMLMDESLAKRLSIAAQEHCKKFSMEELVKKTLTVYCDLV